MGGHGDSDARAHRGRGSSIEGLRQSPNGGVICYPAGIEDIDEFKSRGPNALRDPLGSNIWVGTRLDPLHVVMTAIKFWSGARDLNPGPHGPEIWAASSTETVFVGFEIDSRHRASHLTGFEPFQSLGLLHELLHENARLSSRRIWSRTRCSPPQQEDASAGGICINGDASGWCAEGLTLGFRKHPLSC